jgi:hypothetical protein
VVSGPYRRPETLLRRGGFDRAKKSARDDRARPRVALEAVSSNRPKGLEVKPRNALAILGALLAVAPASALANPSGAQHATVTGGDNDLIDLGGGGGNDVFDLGGGNDLIDLGGGGDNDVIDVTVSRPDRSQNEWALLQAMIASREPARGGNDGWFTGMTDEEAAEAAGELPPARW